MSTRLTKPFVLKALAEAAIPTPWQRGVFQPLDTKYRSGNVRKYPFSTMGLNDSFLIPCQTNAEADKAQRNSSASSISYARNESKYTGHYKVFTTRKVKTGIQVIRIS